MASLGKDGRGVHGQARVGEHEEEEHEEEEQEWVMCHDGSKKENNT